jgi:hypothetical protein
MKYLVTILASLLAALPVGAASLSMVVGTPTNTSTSANLTTSGLVDWVVFTNNTTANDWANGAGHTIGNLVPYTANATGTYTNDLRTISWTNGTNTPTQGGETDGIYNVNATYGFSITLPASTSTTVAYVYLGAYEQTPNAATVTASLSDSSAGPVTDSVTLGGASGPCTAGQCDSIVTITYAAASSGQSMTLTWYNNNASPANVSAQAAAIYSVTAPGSHGVVLSGASHHPLVSGGAHDPVYH